MSTLGSRIHDLRIAYDLTLQDLGDKVGVSASTVRKWEIGYIKTLRTDKLTKLAEALRTTVPYLMGWEESGNVAVTGNNNNIVNNSNDIDLNSALSKEEIELLRIYRNASVKARFELLSAAFAIDEKNEKH